MQSLGEKDNRIKTDDDIWKKEEEPMVNFCFKIIQFQQRLQCVMNCFQHLNQAERQGAQLSQRGMAVRRPQCVCVCGSLCDCLCVLGKKLKRKQNDKLTRERKRILAKWARTKRNFTPTHPLRAELCRTQAANGFGFLLTGNEDQKLPVAHLVFVYDR